MSTSFLPSKAPTINHLFLFWSPQKFWETAEKWADSNKTSSTNTSSSMVLKPSTSVTAIPVFSASKCQDQPPTYTNIYPGQRHPRYCRQRTKQPEKRFRSWRWTCQTITQRKTQQNLLMRQQTSRRQNQSSLLYRPNQRKHQQRNRCRQRQSSSGSCCICSQIQVNFCDSGWWGQYSSQLR